MIGLKSIVTMLGKSDHLSAWNDYVVLLDRVANQAGSWGLDT